MSNISNLLAIGLDSDLAQRVVAAGYNLSKLRAAPKRELAGYFNDVELDRLWEASKRKSLPPKTLARLVEDCDWKCCLCWDIRKESPVIVHHIEEHSKTQDDSYENLVILCLNHHAEVHTEWKISRSPLPAELIKRRKQEWIEAVAGFKAGSRPAPGHEPPSARLKAAAPTPPQFFTGRHKHLITLIDSYTRDRAVAYTLQGMGGVGKTATAKKIAAELISHFPGGIFWGALSDHDGNPGPIFRNWARVCDRELPKEADAESLAYLLRNILTAQQSEEGRLLVILDDVREKWLDAAKLVRQVTPHSASFLATARNEAVATAIDTEIYHIDEMTPDEALTLLNAHVNSPVVLNESESAKAILLVLGHLPLAIELAAKRIAFLSRKPGYLLEDFYQIVRQRAVQALTLPGHPGLAATFGITYEALSSQEQRLFRWLSVFAEGSLDLMAVAGVADVDPAQAETMLDNMVASALISWGDEKGQYNLHPLLRQYSQILLSSIDSTGEARKAGQRHLAYYLDIVESNSEEDPSAHANLGTHLPDILKALNFAEEISEYDVVNKGVMSLWGSSFLSTRGHIRISVDLLTKAVKACRRLGDRTYESIHLGQLGVAYSYQGRTKEAIDCYTGAIAICREIGNRYDECAHLGNLGMAYQHIGQIDSAVDCYQQAINIGAEVANNEVILNQLGNLASIYRHQGRRELALKYYEDALTIARTYGKRLSEGNYLSNIGLIYFDFKYYGVACAYIAQALNISRKIGDRKGESNRLGHLGNIIFQMGYPKKSIEYYEEALGIIREIEHYANEASWLSNLGNVYRYLGETDKAIAYYEQALAISREINNPDGQGIALTNLGATYREIGDIEKARQYLIEAIEIFKATNSDQIHLAEEVLAKLNSQI